MRNRDITIAAVVAVVVLVIVLVFLNRSKEEYVLPDVTGPEICPVGFVLSCVSKELGGILDTIPFPSSLPQPCEETYTPLCLPGQQYIKPAYSKK
jgi:hypothetical protein